MLTYGIPSYKLEKNIIDAEIEVIKELGVEIKCGVEVGKDVTIQDLKKQGYKAFYVAVGCQGGKLPNIKNEDANGVDIAVNFLAKATDNQDQILDGDVVVVGGGNVAIDCARTATRFKANKVTMVCLESRETMPASKDEIMEAEEENVIINNGWGPKEILVDENNNVKAIVFKKCLSTLDKDHKFNPIYDEEQTIIIDAKHIIFAIGQTIVWKDLLKDTKVTYWHGNYPIADKLTYQTADPDIFVGGDVYTGPKFAIDAIEAGKCAAESLHRYVQPGTSLTIGRNRRDFIMLNKQDITIPQDYDHAQRQITGMNENIDAKSSFRDAHLTLTEEQVKIETSRCLGCGVSVVDPNKCIGCGVCKTKCMFDAITLTRDHPECSTMIKSEDKFKAILPYAIKRGFKIKFGKHTDEEKASIKKHKEYKKNLKKENK